MLSEQLDDLHALARALLEYETLSGDDAMRILRGETARSQRSVRRRRPAAGPPRLGAERRGGDAAAAQLTGGGMPGLQPQG